MKRLTIILAISTLSLAACAGEFEMSTDSEMVGENADQTSSSGAGTESGDGESGPAFELKRENIRLLPFHVRMTKLSRVTGLARDDAAFDLFYRNRYDLGDHNYGQNIGPDLSWSASKMALWVESLRPVCASEAMTQKYPYLPEHLNELITDAYGREADEQDLATFEDVLADSELTEEEKYEAVCIGVMASTEFVAQ